MVNKNRLENTFLEMANINSPTFQEKELADYVIESLMELGIEAFTDDSYHATGCNIGNIIARLPGNTPANPVMLNAHLDTIEPTEGIKIIKGKKSFKTDGSSILGADNKAGIAVIIEAVRVLNESDLMHGPVELVFTVAEEKGLLGARNLDYSKIKSKDGYVFDSGGPANTLVIGAPTQNNFDFTFKGRPSHAGVDPERGKNAILASARAIAAMPLGRIDSQTTANVGIISGGTAVNVVPAQCVVRAEARSHSEEKLAELTQNLIEAANKGAKETGVKVTTNVEKIYKGYKIEQKQPVFRVAELAIKEQGDEPFLTLSGGGSDANILNERGINAITLSAGGYEAHAASEFLSLEDLHKSAMNALKIIEIYAGQCTECFI